MPSLVKGQQPRNSKAMEEVPDYMNRRPTNPKNDDGYEKTEKWI